jgi:hypothetical protein
VTKKKTRKPQKEAEWEAAQKRCHLSAEEVQMARELGFSARSLIKNVPNRSEPWKAPVNEWIRHLYEKRMKKARAKKPHINENQSATTAMPADEADMQRVEIKKISDDEQRDQDNQDDIPF